MVINKKDWITGCYSYYEIRWVIYFCILSLLRWQNKKMFESNRLLQFLFYYFFTSWKPIYRQHCYVQALPDYPLKPLVLFPKLSTAFPKLSTTFPKLSKAFPKLSTESPFAIKLYYINTTEITNFYKNS